MRSISRCAGRAASFTAVLCAAVVLPAVAEAGTVTGDGGLEYRASAGERNGLRVFIEFGQVTVTDRVAFRGRGRCENVTPFKARCGASVSGGTLRLGDQDDTALIQISTPGLLFVNGENGEDTFAAGTAAGASHVVYSGGRHSDTVDYGAAGRAVRLSVNNRSDDGRPGDRDSIATDIEVVRGSNHGDTISGSNGIDSIDGRDGGDVIRAGGGSDGILQGPRADGGDFISGGSGHDTVIYKDRRTPVRVTFENDTRVQNDGAAGEGDNVMNDIETVWGGHAGDTLNASPAGGAVIGGPGDDKIIGTRRRDSLHAGPGADLVSGHGGDDALFLFDSERDFADCGPGNDGAQTDELDFAGNCERVKRLEVGKFRLSPRTLTARAGRTSTWRLRWTHPVRWTDLDQVRLILTDHGRRVGVVRFDEQTRKVRARGRAIRLVAGRTAVRAAGPQAQRVQLRLAFQIAERYTGRTLTAKLAASDDDGTRQKPRKAGRIKVR